MRGDLRVVSASPWTALSYIASEGRSPLFLFSPPLDFPLPQVNAIPSLQAFPFTFQVPVILAIEMDHLYPSLLLRVVFF